MMFAEKKTANPQNLNNFWIQNFQYTRYNQISIRMIKDVAMQDYQVQSKIKQRIANALDFSESYNIDEVKEEVTEYIKKVFNSIDVNKNRLIKLLLKYCWFGCSAIRVIWNDNKRIIDLKEIPSENFMNYENMELSGIVKDVMQVSYPLNFDEFSNPMNFLFYKNEDFNSELTAIYNLCAFRKRVIELWDRAFDKSSIPAVVALLKDSIQKPDGYDTMQDFADALTEKMESLRSGAGVVLQGVENLTTLATGIQSSNFEIAMNAIDEAISLVILGSGRTTNAQSKGSYASDKTSEEAIYRLAKEDNQLLEQFINILIKWQVWAQFGYEEKAPILTFDREKSATLEELNTAIDRGVEISAEAYYKKVDKPKDETDILKVELKQKTNEPVVAFSELPRLKFS